VISLLIVPMFYVWFDELNNWRRRVFARTPAPAGAPGSVVGPLEGVAESPAGPT
jgi:hypothetical protein